MTCELKAKHKKRDQGFTYIEVIIAVMVLSIALIPAIRAVRESLAVSRGQEMLVANTYSVYAKMEYVLAQPYETLSQAAMAAGTATIPTSLSDPAATPGRRLVYLASYDGDNEDSDNNPFTGGEPDLLWVKVQLEGEPLSMESLVTRY